MAPGNRIVGQGGQVVGVDVQGAGELEEQVHHAGTAIGIGERQSRVGILGLEDPAVTRGMGFDPAFQRRLAAEVDPAGALRVLGVGDDHEGMVVVGRMRDKLSWLPNGHPDTCGAILRRGVWRGGTWITVLFPGAGPRALPFTSRRASGARRAGWRRRQRVRAVSWWVPERLPALVIRRADVLAIRRTIIRMGTRYSWEAMTVKMRAPLGRLF